MRIGEIARLTLTCVQDEEMALLPLIHKKVIEMGEGKEAGIVDELVLLSGCCVRAAAVIGGMALLIDGEKNSEKTPGNPANPENPTAGVEHPQLGS